MTVCHARCCFRHKQRTANLFHIWKFFFKRQRSSNYCRHDIKPVSDLPYFAPSRVPICSHKIRWVHFHNFFLQKHDCIVQMDSCNPSLFDIYSCSIYCSIEGSVLFPIGHQVFLRNHGRSFFTFWSFVYVLSFEEICEFYGLLYTTAWSLFLHNTASDSLSLHHI